MWKKVLAATAVLAIAGTPFVYAQRAGGPNGNTGPDRRPGMDRPMMGPDARRDMNGWQPSTEDMSAFADARIAGMKAGLRLTPDQEKNWPAFETAYRGLAKLRMDRVAAAREARAQQRQRSEQGNAPNGEQNRGPDRTGHMVERMQRNANAMATRANAFKQFADAAAPLYQSLDDGQKRRFGVLAHMLRPQPMKFARGMERGFNRDERAWRGRDERGFGPGGPGRFERQRFGAAEGQPGEDFAAASPPPAQPDLTDFDIAELGPDVGAPDER